jgi:hypothetical protein
VVYKNSNIEVKNIILFLFLRRIKKKKIQIFSKEQINLKEFKKKKKYVKDKFK